MSRENLSPLVLNRLARELRGAMSNPQTGFKIVVNEADLADVQCDIEGPASTPYEGGMFRCKLVIGVEFPAAPPRGVFLTKIFHPNVSPSGEICVNTLKKDWNPELGLMDILQTIRCLLIVPFPESALNEEASRLFIESYDEYFARAKMLTSIHATPSPAATPTPPPSSSSSAAPVKTMAAATAKPASARNALKRL